MCAMGGGPESGSPVVVGPAHAEDVPAVAALHVRAISEGFLSSLGERFLRRLYRRVLVVPGSVLFVAHGGGEVVGFVAGSRHVTRLFAEFARRDGVAAALGSPWRLARSWRRVLETRRLGSAERNQEAADGELLAIAVAARWRGHDIGRRLVETLLEAMRDAGAARVDVVVGADNAPAIALYHRAGFGNVRSFEVHSGTTSLLLRHSTVPAAEPGRP
jgi:ribosomal protein S18 acetylase RimI-like enzyme